MELLFIYSVDLGWRGDRHDQIPCHSSPDRHRLRVYAPRHRRRVILDKRVIGGIGTKIRWHHRGQLTGRKNMQLCDLTATTLHLVRLNPAEFRFVNKCTPSAERGSANPNVSVSSGRLSCWAP